MRRILRENGLSLVLFGLFLLFLAGQIIVGRASYNQDRDVHGQPSVRRLSIYGMPILTRSA